MDENMNKIQKRSERLSLAQNYLLIWLDSNLNESAEDFSHSLKQLRQIVNTINTYSDYRQCLEFINKAKDENLLMILSGSLGQQIIGDLHPIPQITSIYIFCSNILKHEKWAKQWSKIAGVFSNIQSICDQLKKDSRQCERDSTSFEIINQHDLNQLEPTFMYTNLFKDIILEMKYDKNDFDNLVEQCRLKYEDNKGELKIIEEFESAYKKHSPVWWYTRECFTYHILNRSLRTFEVEMIISLGPFIRDLHQYLQQLHSQQKHSFQQKFLVYRGQGLLQIDFDRLKQSTGGLLSFNNFLSTSTNRSISLEFARNSLYKNDYVAILFQMKIDPSIDKSTFASLDNQSYFSNSEREILFSMNSVFRVGSIQLIDDSQVYQVDLTLTTSSVDQQIQALYQQTQQEIQGSTPQHRLAHLLIKLGNADKSEQLYKSLIANTSKDNYQEYCHLNQMLVVSYLNQEKNQQGIELCHQVIQFIEKYLPNQRIELAKTYCDLGIAYEAIGEYLEALKYYGKSLEIRKDSLPNDHLDLAKSYIHLGNMHRRLTEFPKALQNYTVALEIRQKSLPPIHVDIAIALNNLGNTYSDVNDFSKAEEYLQKSFEIGKKCVPPFHPLFIMLNNNLGNHYRSIGENVKAVQYFENGLKISEKTLSANDSRLAEDYNTIAVIYQDIRDNPKAIEFFLKALNIRQISLPQNHPDLANSYNNLGFIYYLVGQSDKALEYLQKSIDIKLNIDTPLNSNLIMPYRNIANVYKSLGESLKMIEFIEKIIQIQQISLPPNHPDLVYNYLDIANAYASLKEYSKAIKHQQKINQILIKKSVSTNNPELAQNYYDIAHLYHQMTDYDQASTFYQKSIQVQETCFPQNNCQLILFYKSAFDLHELMGEYFKAIEINEKLINFIKKSLPQNQLELNRICCQTAQMYYELKNYPNALERFSKLLQTAENTLPCDYIDLLSFNSRIAEIYFLLGQPDQALPKFKICQNILQISPNLNQFVVPVCCLGDLYSASNDYQTAIQYFQKAFQLERQIHTEKTLMFGKINSQIGNLQQLTEEYGNALISLQNAMHIQKTLICSRIDLALTYNYLGETHRKIKNYSVALEFYDKALKIREKLSYRNHPDLADLYRNLAELHYETGQTNLAYECIQKGIDIFRQTLSQSHPLFSKYIQTLNKIQQNLI